MGDLSRYQHPRFARMYERMSGQAERFGMAGHRDRLLSGLSGRVVEVGAGNGLNFPHYPAEVREVVAVEPEDVLRGLAERAAPTSPVPVQVVAGHAGELPFDDATFDAAVVSLVLCSVESQAAALAELRRVLRPGGELRFFEHVRSGRRVRATLEHLVTPLWWRLCGGCRPNRDTTAAIRDAGFTIEANDRFVFRPAPGSPSMTHILGRAHR
ncbi:class I SAM-dependent methyltransferase [Nonomuraea cavernae]|nr:class I SAM-dependent methyltransferase [Nonomuraea cavernae]MCA2187579.1 class I SAM-dependent methyltransferase [Nonomuraea cavernae]